MSFERLTSIMLSSENQMRFSTNPWALEERIARPLQELKQWLDIRRGHGQTTTKESAVQ